MIHATLRSSKKRPAKDLHATRPGDTTGLTMRRSTTSSRTSRVLQHLHAIRPGSHDWTTRTKTTSLTSHTVESLLVITKSHSSGSGSLPGRTKTTTGRPTRTKMALRTFLTTPRVIELFTNASTTGLPGSTDQFSPSRQRRTWRPSLRERAVGHIRLRM